MSGKLKALFCLLLFGFCMRGTYVDDVFNFPCQGKVAFGALLSISGKNDDVREVLSMRNSQACCGDSQVI